MQLKFVLCMIKYKIKRKIVNCEKMESVTSHDLHPPVTNCHTFSDPLPPLERDILYGRPLARQRGWRGARLNTIVTLCRSADEY